MSAATVAKTLNEISVADAFRLMASKKNISVRLGVGDLRRVKEIALRLDMKESDIFRFAVKSLSTRLMPLLNRQ
jgi:hypothetical protein